MATELNFTAVAGTNQTSFDASGTVTTAVGFTGTVSETGATGASGTAGDSSQDVPRRGGNVGKGKLATALQTDVVIGDSIARGVGGTLGTTNWSNVLADYENLGAGLQKSGTGIVLVNEDETVYGNLKWSLQTDGSAATEGPVSNSGYWNLTSSGHTIGDARIFRKATVYFKKATSGSPTIQVSTDNGSSWSTDISTTGSGYGSWTSADLGSATLRTLKVKTTGAGTATIIGYTPYLTAASSGVVIDNLAHGGTRINGLLTYRGWESYLSLVQPRRLIISAMTGEAFDGVTVDVAAGYMTTLVTRAQAASPLTEIVIVGEYYASKPTSGAAYTNVGVSTWASVWIPAMQAVATANNCTFVNLYDRFGDCSEGVDPYSLTMDAGLHFGAAGQVALAQTFAEKLDGIYAPLNLENYAYLPGLSGGQTLIGGTATSDSLTLSANTQTYDVDSTGKIAFTNPLSWNKDFQIDYVDLGGGLKTWTWRGMTFGGTQTVQAGGNIGESSAVYGNTTISYSTNQALSLCALFNAAPIIQPTAAVSDAGGTAVWAGYISRVSYQPLLATAITATTDRVSGFYSAPFVSINASSHASSAVVVSSLNGHEVFYGNIAPDARVTITTARGIWVRTPSKTGTVTSASGLDIDAMTVGTSNYGARIGAAATQTLWVNHTSDTTTAAGGIVFGTSGDTNLYRSAANTLKTDDDFVAGSKLYVPTSQTPATAAATGTAGQIAWDSNYIYVCVAANTWKRSAITTW